MFRLLMTSPILKRFGLLIAAPFVAIGLKAFSWFGGYELSMYLIFYAEAISLVLMLGCLCLLGACVWNCLHIKRSGSGRRILVCLGSLLIYFYATTFVGPSSMNGFIARWKKDVDPNVLQQWAEKTVAQNGRRENRFQIPKDEHPPFLKKLETERKSVLAKALLGEVGFFVTVERDHINILWASHSGGLGLKVGPASYNLETSRRIIQCRPGVYFYWPEAV